MDELANESTFFKIPPPVLYPPWAARNEPWARPELSEVLSNPIWFGGNKPPEYDGYGSKGAIDKSIDWFVPKPFPKNELYLLL